MNSKAVIVKGIPSGVVETAVCVRKSIDINGQLANVEKYVLRKQRGKYNPKNSRRKQNNDFNRDAVSLEKYSRSVYLASIPDTCTESSISEVFSKFGSVSRILFRSNISGRRYVFIEFESNEAASAAIEQSPINVEGSEIEVQARRLHTKPTQKLNSIDLLENGAKFTEEMKVEAKNVTLRTPPKPELSIYISGFPLETTEEMIKEEFSKYGTIASTIMRVKQTESDDVRTWSFVEYQESESVAKALDARASGIEIGGSKVIVEARKSEPKLFRGYFRGYRNNWRGASRGRRGRFPRNSPAEPGA